MKHCPSTRRKRKKRQDRSGGVLYHAFIILAAVQLPAPHTSGLTITTFNMLAPMHRSMDASNTRESEKDEWWIPRTECIGNFICEELASSDIILLQEWWFRDEFVVLFDSLTGHLFDRVAERRPAGLPSTSSVTNSKDCSRETISPLPMREDGMAVLIRKEGKLELLESKKILTGSQRIAQFVRCRERTSKGAAREVVIGNVHLSFPGHPNQETNDRRQASEVQLIARALSKLSFAPVLPQSDYDCVFGIPSIAPVRLEIIGGDFNSNSRGLAASKLESQHSFVNCASASSEQALSSSGGQVNLGVTHRNHRGEDVSVDHIFTRLSGDVEQHRGTNRRGHCSARQLGYLDTQGTRVVDCYRGERTLDGGSVISDHLPVTASLEWPEQQQSASSRIDGKSVLASLLDRSGLTNLPLDPLEPPSYIPDSTG